MTDTNPNKLHASDKVVVMRQNILNRRKARRENRGKGMTADWKGVNAELLRELIEVVTLNKGTVTLGYTRDGGAYYISYYFGDESEANYCRPAEDIDAFLAGEIESFKVF